MTGVWRALVLSLGLLACACQTPSYPPDDARAAGVTVHMGGSINSFAGAGSSR